MQAHISEDIMLAKFAAVLFVIAMVNAQYHGPKEIQGKDDHMDHLHHHRPKPYSFGYNIMDRHSKKHRYEEADGSGTVRGEYGYMDKDGVHRVVEYVADHDGFRATVKTNERGTENKDPADTQIYSSYEYEEIKDHIEKLMNQNPQHHSSPMDEDENDALKSSYHEQ